MNDSGLSTTRNPEVMRQNADVPHRAYYCAMPDCGILVEICVLCDHGNIYCPLCSNIARRERIRRAQNKYRETRRGRSMRALAERRRRRRRQRQKKARFLLLKRWRQRRKIRIAPQRTRVLRLLRFVGDRGRLASTPSTTTPRPALAPEKGIESEDFAQSCVEEGDKPQRPVHGRRVVCSFCDSVCSSFRRSGKKKWREEKHFWRRRRTTKGGP